MSVEIVNDQGFVVDEDSLRLAAETVLNQHDLSDHELTVVIADNDEVSTLNQQYRGIEAPTDVLSFPAEALPEEIEEVPYLGDIIIAYPYAAAQAEREQHDLRASLMLLVIHGTLHLLGYDHDSHESRAQMWEVQERALKTLNLPMEIVPALEGYQPGSPFSDTTFTKSSNGKADDEENNHS